MRTFELTYYYKNRYVFKYIEARDEREAREQAPKNAENVEVKEFTPPAYSIEY